MSNLDTRLDAWLGSPDTASLRVLVLVGDGGSRHAAIAAELRRSLGPEANVLGTGAPAEVLDPYGGFLAAFLTEDRGFDSFLETLPPEVMETPQTAVPRTLAQSVVNLARARSRLRSDPMVWIVSPADGLTPGGQLLLEELAELAPAAAPHVPRLVLTLTLPESGDLLLALRRRLPSDGVEVIDVGAGPVEPSDRMRQVTEGARAILELLALSPGAVSVDVIASALECPVDAVQESLRELARSQLLIERSRPELFPGPERRAVLSSLGEDRGKGLQERLALAHGKYGASPALCAYHDARGEDPSRAVGSLIEAASRCRLLGEREMAHAALREAYLLLKPDQWYRRIEILERCVETLTELGQFHEALQAQEEIAELASVYGDEDRPERSSRIAQSYRKIGRFDEAARALDRASAACADRPDLMALILLERGELSFATGDREKARELAEEALRRVDAGSKSRLALQAIDLQFRIAFDEGRMDESMRCGRQLLDGAVQAGDVWMMGNAHNELGHVYYVQSFFDEALHHYAEALRCFERRGDRTMVTGLLINMGMTHYERGALPEAEELLSRALTLKEREGDLDGVAKALNNLGAVYEARGQHHRAMEMVRKALSILRETRDERSEAMLCANLAGSYATLGLPEEAEAEIRRTEAIALRTGAMGLGANVAETRGEIAIARGDWDQAERELRRARDLLAPIGARIQEAMVLVNLARVASMRGDSASASRIAGEAVAIATEVGHPGQIAWARLSLAHATVQKAPLRAEALAREAMQTQGLRHPDFVAEGSHVLSLALAAQGRFEEGLALLREAVSVVNDAASQIPEGPERAAYVAHPTRARILERARKLGA